MHSHTPVWVYFTPLLLVVIGYLVAVSRTGKVAGASMGGRRLEVHTPADPKTAFERILTIGGKFKVDDRDPEGKILVLSSSVTFGTWGFLYPVYIHPAADGGGSHILIGIHSKFIQWGPLVTKWHKQCARAIEELLAPPTARVA
jgi:hypothetical protein